jgi:hypothetical protein
MLAWQSAQSEVSSPRLCSPLRPKDWPRSPQRSRNSLAEQGKENCSHKNSRSVHIWDIFYNKNLCQNIFRKQFRSVYLFLWQRIVKCCRAVPFPYPTWACLVSRTSAPSSILLSPASSLSVPQNPDWCPTLALNSGESLLFYVSIYSCLLCAGIEGLFYNSLCTCIFWLQVNTAKKFTANSFTANAFTAKVVNRECIYRESF